ncbi:MAG: DUF4262 domain-containing protein [Litorimonas sp.]
MTSSFSQYERDLIANVETHGWQATHVFDPKGGPAFTYSVGFPQTLGCPDCIIVGLKRSLMHNMLWELFHQIRKGKALVVGASWDGLLGGDFQCVSVRIRSDLKHSDFRLSSSEWYLRKVMKSDTPFEAFQIVWPSVQGHMFPWDDDCPIEVLDVQPLLGEPPSN